MKKKTADQALHSLRDGSLPGAMFLDLIKARHIFLFTEEWRQELDPELDQDPLGVTERRVARALRVLLSEAPQYEVQRFHVVEQIAVQTGRVYAADLTDDDQIPEAWRWFVSFFLWGTYLERGESSVLCNLPPNLFGNLKFFLQQWWVSGLIDSWHKQGEQAKIERLLFGVVGRGKRSFKTRMLNQWRDLEIYIRVERLRSQGVRYNAAIGKVKDQIKDGKLGIGEVLDFSSVRTIYEKVRPSKLRDPR